MDKTEGLNRINEEQLADVVGGKTVAVNNDSTYYANLRSAPGLSSKSITKLENVTVVETTGKKEYKDGYTWYQVYVVGSEDCFGWIAGSLIGF